MGIDVEVVNNLQVCKWKQKTGHCMSTEILYTIPPGFKNCVIHFLTSASSSDLTENDVR